MFKCFNCGSSAVIWESDFMSDECGYLDYGIVRLYHCNNCDSDIEYFIPLKNEEENEKGGTTP